MGSSSLVRDRTWAPCIGSTETATRPPEKSQDTDIEDVGKDQIKEGLVGLSGGGGGVVFILIGMEN